MSDEPTKFILGDTAISSVEEPGRKRFFHRRNRERQPLTHCENCGAPLHGHWCAQCGQPAIDYRRSFRHVIVDVLDSFLNWDSKFFATLGLLISKPWRLTSEFLAGKRVRYVHPGAALFARQHFVFFRRHLLGEISAPESKKPDTSSARRDRGRSRKEESNARTARQRRKGVEDSASGNSG